MFSDKNQTKTQQLTVTYHEAMIALPSKVGVVVVEVRLQRRGGDAAGTSLLWLMLC